MGTNNAIWLGPQTQGSCIEHMGHHQWQGYAKGSLDFALKGLLCTEHSEPCDLQKKIVDSAQTTIDDEARRREGPFGVSSHRRLRSRRVTIITWENVIFDLFCKRGSFGWAVYP